MAGGAVIRAGQKRVLPVTIFPVTLRPLIFEVRVPFWRFTDLICLLQDPLVAHLRLELRGVELLQLGLLEVTAGDAAVELDARHGTVGAHDPRRPDPVEGGGVHPRGSRRRSSR